MNIQQVSNLVNQLDSSIPKEGATVKFIAGYDESEDEIVGTQEGLLRLGVEFLRAGLTKGQFFANTELKYLNHKESNYDPWLIRVVDEIPPNPKPPLKKRSTDFLLGMLGFIVICAAIGLFSAIFRILIDRIIKLF
jgi:hypothetical protein